MLNGRLVRHFGRRGVVLGLLGAMWCLLGYGFITMPQDRFSRDGSGGPLQVLDDLTTPWFGLLWVAGGLLAIASAFLRPYYPRDDYGFVGLSVPATLWSGLYFWSWMGNVVFGPEIGRPNSWLAAVVFAALAGLVLFVARWPDPDDPYVMRGVRGLS